MIGVVGGMVVVAVVVVEGEIEKGTARLSRFGKPSRWELPVLSAALGSMRARSLSRLLKRLSPRPFARAKREVQLRLRGAAQLPPPLVLLLLPLQPPRL